MNTSKLKEHLARVATLVSAITTELNWTQLNWTQLHSDWTSEDDRYLPHALPSRPSTQAEAVQDSCPSLM